MHIKNHLITTFHTNNSHKNHHTNTTRVNIFVIINQINKHKAKIYNHCTYTLIIIKKFVVIIENIYNYIKCFFLHLTNIKKKNCLLDIRMINLLFNELKLIAQYRNISNYENKSKEDLIKALSEPKPETLKPK